MDYVVNSAPSPSTSPGHSVIYIAYFLPAPNDSAWPEKSVDTARNTAFIRLPGAFEQLAKPRTIMAQPPIPLTHGRHEMLAPVARLNGRVFSDDPVITYMLLDMPTEERLAYLPTYWAVLVKSALLNGAVITEADNWKAASVIVPPGKRIDNAWTLFYAGFFCVLWKMGLSGFKRLWSDFSGMTDNAKRIGLRGQKRYYYIFSIGTEVEHRGKGLAKTIMREHMRRAQLENVPIWLEATSPNSRKLYLSMGFEEIEEITLGKGKVDENANRQPGGPGVPLWAMVWFPEEQDGGTSS